MDTVTSKEELEEKIQQENPDWWNQCPIGKENVYSCTVCKKYIVTVDVDHGIAPWAVICKFPPCTGDMISHGYPSMESKPDVVPDAGWEWYRPEVITGTPDEVRHLMNGGLLLRERLVNV